MHKNHQFIFESFSIFCLSGDPWLPAVSCQGDHQLDLYLSVTGGVASRLPLASGVVVATDQVSVWSVRSSAGVAAGQGQGLHVCWFVHTQLIRCTNFMLNAHFHVSSKIFSCGNFDITILEVNYGSYGNIIIACPCARGHTRSSFSFLCQRLWNRHCDLPVQWTVW